MFQLFFIFDVCYSIEKQIYHQFNVRNIHTQTVFQLKFLNKPETNFFSYFANTFPFLNLKVQVQKYLHFLSSSSSLCVILRFNNNEKSVMFLLL